MIRTFPEAYQYVNERYIYDAKSYPILAKLTPEEQKIFALKHGLLHIIKSFSKIDSDIPYQKGELTRVSYFAEPDDQLLSIARRNKEAYLKIVVNIVSIANIAGLEEDIPYLDIPSDEEMKQLIPSANPKHPVIATFRDMMEYFIAVLATILEQSDHTNSINDVEIIQITVRLYLATLYWFDAEWAPNFLGQIPNVMKGK